jgi:ribosomal protein S18 acetylase RimI-like enzyme
MASSREIAENLYEMYGDIAASGMVTSGRAGSFDFIMHPGYAWPNMSYCGSIPPLPDLRPLAERVGSDKPGPATFPRLVIFEETDLAADTLNQLTELRFKPAARWTSMFLPLDPLDPLDPQDPQDLQDLQDPKGEIDCRIVDVNSAPELRAWISIPEAVLFKNGKLDAAVFRYAGGTDRFKLITGYFDDRPVSTCLVYLGRNAGVYMVATLPSFQGRGIAGQVMKYAQSIARNNGYESLVLHSTPAGLEFYKRIGFASPGNMILYYCMI